MMDIAMARHAMWRSVGYAVSMALWVLVAALLGCQAIIWLQPASPELSLVEQFALHLCALAAIGAICALAVRRWRQGAALAMLIATFAWPIVASHHAASAVADDRRLTILSANLWFAAPKHQKTIDALMASDADIIGLVEVSDTWRQVLMPLFAKYPYRVDCFGALPECETILLSKLPIVAPRAERVLGGTPVVVGGEVDWNGRRFEVLATHLIWPFTPDRGKRWSVLPDPIGAPYLDARLPATRLATQAENLALLMNRLPPDLVVMGDFNGAPWSRVQRAFTEKTGLGSAAGWDLSWPSMLPWPFRLPIDHVLARGRLVVTDFRAGPVGNSDHLPVIAEIGWRD